MQDAPTENAEQIEYWNGDAGQRWASNQARTDVAFRRLTEALLERAGPKSGERVIDVGCGAGAVSRAVAERVGRSGHVLGVDVSKPMLDQARASQGDFGGVVEWQEADAGSFRFAPGEADLLISRFGVMFFAEPLAAFRNMRHGLSKGGRLAMLCWRPLVDNPWFNVPRTAVLQVVPPPEPTSPDAPGPLAFSDAARVGAILAHAGFTDVRSSVASAPLQLDADPDGELEAAVEFLTMFGPASRLILDADAAVRPRAIAAVREAVQTYGVQNTLRGSCWLYTAMNPG